MNDNIKLMTKRQILEQNKRLEKNKIKRLKLFLNKLYNFIRKLERGELKINRYHLFAENISSKVYDTIVYPYFMKMMIREKLLFKISRTCFGKIYLKNVDTESYRKRIYLYFTYLTQGKGIKPPTFFDAKSAIKLVVDIRSLCSDYGFTIDIKKYYDTYYNMNKYKIFVY
jgi:hypothetical protein